MHICLYTEGKMMCITRMFTNREQQMKLTKSTSIQIEFFLKKPMCISMHDCVRTHTHKPKHYVLMLRSEIITIFSNI